ncbi:MAG: hypothetical protein LUI02_00790 [Clostridiales bacterium]|nr:hypothetical protein [Clostridiales bacterium]
MKIKEPLNIYRFISITAIILVTVGVTVALYIGNRPYADEWACVAFVDIIFILIFVFELEYERRKDRVAYNTQNNFVRIAVLFAVCAGLTYAMSYLPEFYRPVIIIPILLCAASNSTLAVVGGLFFDILLELSSGGNFYAMMALCLMTILGAVLAEALEKKRYRLRLAIIMLFLNLIVPAVFYYLSNKEIENKCFFYGLAEGIVTALVAFFLFGMLHQEKGREMDDLYLDITADDFSEVKALKNYSMIEYRHAKKVADIAYRCAKAAGCDAHLCMAGGFYYRMGRWLGEPYSKRIVRKAVGLSFPDPLTRILLEYYGEEFDISSPESALVHMVDALVKKVDALEADVGKSEWNHDILLYQTLNEFSASGLYDKSGLSMNQFLKAREFLAKEEEIG